MTTTTRPTPAREPARPRWATPRTPGRRTVGRRVAKVARAMNRQLIPWQDEIADVAGELLDDGSWAYTIIVITVQRQAGKTTLVGAVNCERCLTKPDALTWLTAQKRQDARDTMEGISKLALRSRFGSMVKQRKSNGSEGLTFPTGSTFRVFAPTEDALHGKSNEAVTVDEAWAFDAAEGAMLDQAIMPTFTTTGGQLWIVSTAGTAKSVWLREMIEKGRAAVEAGRTEGIAYFEYSLDDAAAAECEQLLADADPATMEASRDRAFELILAAHPGYPYTLKLPALKQAAEKMTPGEILRAYGNRWTGVADRVIPEHVWNAGELQGMPAPEPGAVALAFDVAVDGADAAIGGAWHAGGKVRFDVLDHGAGDGWLVDRLVEFARRWRVTLIGYDKAGPAVDIADALRRKLAADPELAHVEVVGTTLSEYAAACAGFLRAVTNRRAEHRGAAVLNDAVKAAGKRDVGDGAFAWSRRNSAESIAPLVAVTVAGWMVDRRPEEGPAPGIVVPGVTPTAAQLVAVERSDAELAAALGLRVRRVVQAGELVRP